MRHDTSTEASLRLASSRPSERPTARGKFISSDSGKLLLRGVTYGTFEPGADGRGYPESASIEDDFAAIAAHGFNCVRTYTVPPRRLLDAADRHGLRVLVGLPWEQHVTFLGDRRRARSIVDGLRAGVRECRGHAAVLGYAVGNEIPAPIVRWHGRRRIERFIERLYTAAKDEDPDGLVTYVNYPSTEYLQLPFLDVVCFNVFLESPDRLKAYIARLQNIAGDRPLVLTEIGLDSRRNGLDVQAAALDWQVRAALAAGCAGAFVFSWTDEWHRGGFTIEDWDFGLTTRDRDPKPALATVKRAFSDGAFPSSAEWPRVSVVACTYNGARTLEETLLALRRLDYPDFEVIVVDDGSTDGSGDLAERYGAEVIRTPNRGLAAARNTGLAAATGELVAYLDDDAQPDPQWLRYLAQAFEQTGHAAMGGPNIPPPDDGAVAECVAHAPGGPIHVLVSDEEAEHIPGCNMAFRTDELRAIAGFDPVFDAAGDDVDVCWRLQEAGLTLGFSPAAMVWHKRRDSIRGYLRQQRGYGRAEALLERKWPQKYNGFGHVTWGGHLYGNGGRHPLGRRSRVNYGRWGLGLFQRIYHPPPTSLHALPLLPEWPLLVAVLSAVATLGVLWRPLYLSGVLAAALAAFVLVEAAGSAGRARFLSRRSRRERLKQRLILTWLNLAQPIARLSGRLGSGLTPWRMRGRRNWAVPRPRSVAVWSEHWTAAGDRLTVLEEGLRADGTPVTAGEAFDRWDLEARGGMLGAARLLMTSEEHGAGRQLVRFLIRPRLTPLAIVGCPLAVGVALTAGVYEAWTAATVLMVVAGVLVVRAVSEASIGTAALLRGVRRQQHLADYELEADLRRALLDHAALGRVGASSGDIEEEAASSLDQIRREHLRA